MFFDRHKRLRRTRAARRKRFGAYALLSLIAAAALASGAVWLLRHPRLLVSSVIIEGAESLTAHELLGRVERELEGTYLGIIPRRSTVFFPRSIPERLLADYPRISTAELSRDSLQALVLTIHEREPAALWCADAKALARGNCYFLSENGVVFTEAPRFSGNVYFEILGGNLLPTTRAADAPPPINRALFPPERFREILAFRDALTERYAPVYTLELLAGDDAEFVFANSVKLKVALTKPLAGTLQAIQSAMQTAMLAPAMFATTTPSLQYIDARFRNRVFVK